MELTPEMTKVILEHLGQAAGWVYEKYWRKSGEPESADESKPRKGILVIGPGGTGKTTFAKLISGQLLPGVFGDTSKYDESYGQETFAVGSEGGLEIVVPAGQSFRREGAWTEVRTDLAAGRYSGVIFVAAFGHHTPSGLGYQSHPLYKGNKDDFLASYTEAKRQDELTALDFILPALESAPGKLWLMTLASKQDLWWKDRAEAERFYTDGAWSERLTKLRTVRGGVRFSHEFCPASITMSNLKDPDGIVLFSTTGGYDVEKQSESVKRLFAAFDALRQWEEQL